MTLEEHFTQVIFDGLKGPSIEAFVLALRRADVRLDFLDCLEAVGVDNWSGYEIAQDMRMEANG